MRVFRYTYTGAVIFCVVGSFLSFTSFTVYKIINYSTEGKWIYEQKEYGIVGS